MAAVPRSLPTPKVDMLLPHSAPPAWRIRHHSMCAGGFEHVSCPPSWIHSHTSVDWWSSCRVCRPMH